jgi:hypothetical protein
MGEDPTELMVRRAVTAFETIASAEAAGALTWWWLGMMIRR